MFALLDQKGNEAKVNNADNEGWQKIKTSKVLISRLRI